MNRLIGNTRSHENIGDNDNGSEGRIGKIGILRDNNQTTLQIEPRNRTEWVSSEKRFGKVGKSKIIQNKNI